MPIEDRWDKAAVQAITALPWDMRHKDGLEEIAWRPFDPDALPHTGPVGPKRFYITSADLRKYHHTAVRCLRCKALLARKPAATLHHSAPCRARVDGAV